jgi:putative ABC transport system permease protein
MSRRPGIRRLLHGVGEGIRIALDSVRANPYRSGLTILGIGVGVAVVVIMASLITGVRGSVQEGIEAAGPRNFYVTRVDLSDFQLVQTGSGPDWLRRPSITVDEAHRAARLPAVASAVMSFDLQDPGAEGGITVSADGERITGVIGAAESERWTEYRGGTFVRGRNFIPVEVAEARSVVVVSERLAEDLFGSDDPLGRRIRVSAGPGPSLPMAIVGVFEVPQNPFTDAAAQMAIVPYTTALRRLNIDDEWGQIVVVPRDDVSIDEAEDQIIGMLRNVRGLAPGEANDFSILRSTQLLELFDDFTGVFFIVMLALSSVGLLVGGVGVVGIMLISVTERTREVGIRKALGATRGEILWQFLVESAMLTFLGGAAGLLLGGGLAALVAATTPIPAATPLWAVAISLVMAVVTGMVFGLVPALRAARMEPVEALRFE